MIFPDVIANIPKLKIRVQGTKEDIEWFNHFLEKSYVKIISTSPMFSNKGTVRYFREYIDVRTGGQTSKGNGTYDQGFSWCDA